MSVVIFMIYNFTMTDNICSSMVDSEPKILLQFFTAITFNINTSRLIYSLLFIIQVLNSTFQVPTLNFGGQGTELVYEFGGEMGFLRKMIRQSAHYSVKTTVMWFTTLVSKESNLDETYRLLEAADGLVEHRTVQMEHGQKKSRIVAWTFLDETARERWFR